MAPLIVTEAAVWTASSKAQILIFDFEGSMGNSSFSEVRASFAERIGTKKFSTRATRWLSQF